MRQERESKRLVFGLGVDYHFVDYIKWSDCVNTEILELAFNRGFAFRGRSELANCIALIRSSGDRTIDCDMSGGSAIETKVICSAAVSFRFSEFSAPSWCPSFGLGHSDFNFGVFLNFLDSWVLVSFPISSGRAVSSRRSSRGSSKDLPILVEFSGFLDQSVQCGGLWGKHQEFLLQDCG